MTMADADYALLLSVTGVPVSRETYLRLQAFAAEFRRWNARINLAAPSTLPDLWRRHIVDSAQLLRHDQSSLAWLDLGSGGGFPGAVMAILLGERPGARVTLVESNRKKAAFLQTVLGGLQAPARVLASRVEDVVAQTGAVEVVTARALAPLDSLLGLAAPWLTAGARGLFHKGRDYRAEIDNCRNAWRFDLLEHSSAVDRESVILEIRNLEPLNHR